MLILYVGEDDDSSTRAAIRHVAPHLDGYILEVDTCRDKVNHDVLRDEIFGPVVEMAMEGNLLAIVGGSKMKKFVDPSAWAKERNARSGSKTQG